MTDISAYLQRIRFQEKLIAQSCRQQTSELTSDGLPMTATGLRPVKMW